MAPYQRNAMVNAIMGKRGGGRPASVGGLKLPPYSGIPETPGIGINAGPWQGGGGDFHNTNVPDISGNGPWMGGGGDFIDTRVPGDGQPRRPMNPPGLDPNINYKQPLDPIKRPMNPPGLNPGNEPLDAAIATQNLFNTMQPGYVPQPGGITPLPRGETPQTPGYNGWSKSPQKIGTTIDYGGGGAAWNSMGDFGPGGNVVNNVMPPALPLAQPPAKKGMLGLGSELTRNYFIDRPGGGR